MTYQNEVMNTAHELYRASDGTGRDLFAACLSVAHSLVKERRQRSAVVVSIMKARRKSAHSRIARATAHRMAA